MTVVHHTKIATTANADDTVINSPMAELDSSIVQGEILGPSTTLTISGGVVTLTGGWHKIAAETGTTDDLDTITPAVGALTPQRIVIRADTGDTIAVKHSTGNIELAGAVDISMSGNDQVMLIWDGSNWTDIVVSTAAAPAGNVDIGAHVYDSANQTVADSTLVTLTFDMEAFDTDGIHDTVTNSSRLTCKTAGKYLVWFGGGWSSGDDIRSFDLIKNGASTSDANAEVTSKLSTSAQFWTNIFTVLDLAVNDYMEVVVWQTSGGSLSIIANTDKSARFGMQLIA